MPMLAPNVNRTRDHSKSAWRCGESNPGLSACKADALQLCHITVNTTGCNGVDIRYRFLSCAVTGTDLRVHAVRTSELHHWKAEFSGYNMDHLAMTELKYTRSIVGLKFVMCVMGSRIGFVAAS